MRPLAHPNASYSSCLRGETVLSCQFTNFRNGLQTEFFAALLMGLLNWILRNHGAVNS
jgi:hypothetical protein